MHVDILVAAARFRRNYKVDEGKMQAMFASTPLSMPNVAFLHEAHVLWEVKGHSTSHPEDSTLMAMGRLILRP